jgi:hypothetical protein
LEVELNMELYSSAMDMLFHRRLLALELELKLELEL